MRRNDAACVATGPCSRRQLGAPIMAIVSMAQTVSNMMRALRCLQNDRLELSVSLRPLTGDCDRHV
jgi:hypothetical protein